jgi:hypothetical protein
LRKNPANGNTTFGYKLTVLFVSASFGDYVPKAFFVIDENGNPSAAHPINAVRNTNMFDLEQIS